jgi:hypothetical protein
MYIYRQRLVEIVCVLYTSRAIIIWNMEAYNTYCREGINNKLLRLKYECGGTAYYLHSSQAPYDVRGYIITSITIFVFG